MNTIMYQAALLLSSYVATTGLLISFLIVEEKKLITIHRSVRYSAFAISPCLFSTILFIQEFYSCKFVDIRGKKWQNILK